MVVEDRDFPAGLTFHARWTWQAGCHTSCSLNQSLTSGRLSSSCSGVGQRRASCSPERQSRLLEQRLAAEVLEGAHPALEVSPPDGRRDLRGRLPDGNREPPEG